MKRNYSIHTILCLLKIIVDITKHYRIHQTKSIFGCHDNEIAIYFLHLLFCAGSRWAGAYFLLSLWKRWNTLLPVLKYKNNLFLWVIVLHELIPLFYCAAPNFNFFMPDRNSSTQISNGSLLSVDMNAQNVVVGLGWNGIQPYHHQPWMYLLYSHWIFFNNPVWIITALTKLQQSELYQFLVKSEIDAYKTGEEGEYNKTRCNELGVEPVCQQLLAVTSKSKYKTLWLRAIMGLWEAAGSGARSLSTRLHALNGDWCLCEKQTPSQFIPLGRVHTCFCC